MVNYSSIILYETLYNHPKVHNTAEGVELRR